MVGYNIAKGLPDRRLLPQPVTNASNSLGTLSRWSLGIRYMTRSGREQADQDNILDSFDLCVDRGWSGVLDAVRCAAALKLWLPVISAQDD